MAKTEFETKDNMDAVDHSLEPLTANMPELLITPEFGDDE